MVEGTPMTEREKILGRVREALKHPTHHHAPTEPACGTPATGTPRQWLPKAGESFEEQVALFSSNAEMLKAEFLLLNSTAAVRDALTALREREGWKRAACHSGELTDAFCPWLELPLMRTDRAYEKLELEQCDVGVSECDALVAQTGSVLVTSRSAGGRALSCLPPHHVVLARASQFVADLPAAFELLRKKYAENYPSMISFITGPSRTGDIERILVLGAHGPKKLTILCVRD
jgi:L-lactate dehydrogenase complex protein LldG